jgi:hypothetical protein
MKIPYERTPARIDAIHRAGVVPPDQVVRDVVRSGNAGCRGPSILRASLAPPRSRTATGRAPISEEPSDA